VLMYLVEKYKLQVLNLTMVKLILLYISYYNNDTIKRKELHELLSFYVFFETISFEWVYLK